MTVHKAWSLTATQLRRLANSRYGTTLDEICLGYSHNRNNCIEDDNRLFINSPYLADPTLPPPMGPPTEPQYQLQQPALFGAITHLLGHHSHSPWREEVQQGSDPHPKHLFSALLLDEVRVEAAEVRKRPFNRILLASFATTQLRDDTRRYRSASFEHLLLSDFILGFYGRVKAGILRIGSHRRSLRDARETLVDFLGEDTTARAEAIIDNLLNASGANPAEMLALGQQWMTLVDSIDFDDLDWSDLQIMLYSMVRHAQQHVDSDVKTLQIIYPPSVLPLPKKRAPQNAIEWASELADGGDDDDNEADRRDAAGDDTDAESGEMDDNDDEDEDGATFAAGLGIPHSRYIDYRHPTQKENARAVAMATTLKKLRYRGPNVSRRGVQTPGGRLDTRQLVQMTAQRMRGTTITATPWQRNYTTPNEQPGLTCALVLDTSASMATAQKAILSLNWVFSHATHSIGGTVSTWGFGGDAFEIIRAGTRPASVPTVKDTGAGSSGAALALANAAADAKLETATGARVAVVVTDAALDKGEDEKLDAVFATLRQKGVVTLLLQYGDYTSAQGITAAKIVQCGWFSDDLTRALETEILEAFKAI